GWAGAPHTGAQVLRGCRRQRHRRAETDHQVAAQRGRQEGGRVDVAEAEVRVVARADPRHALVERRLVDGRDDGAGDQVPAAADLERYDGLEVQDVLRPAALADA